MDAPGKKVLPIPYLVSKEAQLYSLYNCEKSFSILFGSQKLYNSSLKLWKNEV